jgi:hypothetical protein
MEIAKGLESDGQLSKDGVQTFNFENKKYNAARTQLLKSYLEQNGSSLDELDRNRLLVPEGERDAMYENLYGILASSTEIHDEIWAYLDRRDAEAKEAKALERLEFQMPGGKTEKSPAVRELLSMKRGEISEAASGKRDFGMELMQCRAGIFKGLEKVSDEVSSSEGYNTLMRKSNPDWAITDFDMEFDHNGKLRFTNVKTVGGCANSIRAAEAHLNAMFTDSKPSELGLAILEAHDDEHGDVEEFKHKVIYQGANGIKIESKEADQAAMAEIGELLVDIGSAFVDFFAGMGIKNPFAIVLDGDGKLSFDKGGLDS